MPAPSIKGTVMERVVADARALVERDVTTRDKASNWLRPEDLELLDQSILASAWYPIESYNRLSLMLRDVEGGGRNEYLREKGRETARGLLEAGLYAQFEYLQRGAEVSRVEASEERFRAFGRDLRLLTTLSRSILNFSEWTPIPDATHEERYVIEIRDADAISEVLCWRSDGFVNEMSRQHGDGDLWRWERTAPDRVVFRMTRDA